LQAQLAALQGQPTVTGCTITSFDRNLKQGMSGDDVKCLQIILNSATDTQVATEGAGSPGNETTYFGPLTFAAVVKFQEKYAPDILATYGLTTGTGFVGTTTRAKLNTLIGVTPPPGVVCGNGVCETGETSTNCPADCPVVAAGLTVALAADTPATTNIPKGAFNQPFTKINLTAGSGGDVKISKITITRTGLSANTDIDLVKLFVGTIQKGNGASLNSNNQAVFTLTTPITVTAGTTTVLTVKADLNSSATTAATVAFGISAATDVVSDASATNGSATGNAMSVVATTIGSVNVYMGPNNPSSDLAPEVGDTGVRILQMQLTCGSTEDVEIRQVIAVKVGTVNTTDISKVELYNDSDSTSLGSVTTFDAEGRATFDLASPLVITKGNSKNLSVKVDIASGSGRTINAKVYDAGAFTITAVGKTYGFGVPLTNKTTDWDAVTSGNQIGQGTPQTIAAGSLTVTKSASTPATGYAAPGGTNVPIVTFDMEAKGEGVTITNFTNTVVLGTATYDQVTNCKLVDENGNTVAGPVDAATKGTATDDFIRFTDAFTVPLGVHKYTVKCNLASAITTGSIQIGFDSSNTLTVASGGVAGTDTPATAITAKGAVSNDSITASPSSSVLGNTLTFQAAALTIVNMTTPPQATIIPGQQNIHFANIALGASASGENINVTSITVTDNVSGAGDPQGDDIANLRLFDASISQANCTGTGRAWDSTLAMCRLAPIMQPDSSTADADDTTTFTLSTPLVVPKAGSSTVKVYGDYKSSGPAANEVHTFLVAAVTDITAIGSTTGTTLTSGMKGDSVTGAGQNMTYGSKGALAAVLDVSRPNSANIAVGEYGTTGIVMTKIKLGGTTNTEDIDIDYVDLTRTSDGTGADADIAAAYLYEGSTLLATGVYKGSSVWRFDLTNYVIPAYGTKVWTVKADFNGTLTGATSTHQNAFDLANTTDLRATGEASGSTIYATAAVTSNDMYIYRSIPKAGLCTGTGTGAAYCGGVASPSGSLVNSTATEVFRFYITADSAGDVELTSGDVNSFRVTLTGKVKDDIVGTDTAVSFKNVTDNTTLDTVTTDVSDIVSGTNGYTITCDFSSNPLSIGAGETKVVKVELDTTDLGDAGDSVQVSIENAGADFHWSDVDTNDIANNTFFTWLPLKGNSLVTPAGSSD